MSCDNNGQVGLWVRTTRLHRKTHNSFVLLCTQTTRSTWGNEDNVIFVLIILRLCCVKNRNFLSNHSLGTMCWTFCFCQVIYWERAEIKIWKVYDIIWSMAINLLIQCSYTLHLLKRLLNQGATTARYYKPNNISREKPWLAEPRPRPKG